MQLEYFYDLGNLFFKAIKYDQTSEVDGFHPDSSDLVNLTDSSCPHAICDLNPFSKCSYPTFQGSITYQEIEALKLSLMVMSSSHNLDKIPKSNQI